jgi:DNA-binding transcriptional LysR family regulator
VTPTEAGLAYFERCSAILAHVEETEAQLSRLHDEPRGVLRVNAPMSFGTMYLGDAIAEFMALYAALKVELMLTDRFIDPLEEGVDVTVRIGALQDSSLIARRIAPSSIVLAASPAYLKEHGTPEVPADLVNHRCLSYGHSVSMQRWQLSNGGDAVTVPIQSQLAANNGEVLCAAAERGLGIARLPTFIMGSALKAGRLVEVLPAYRPADGVIHALYAPNRYLAAKSRVFIDFLVKRFGNMPEWDAV